ncbi:MAG: hypothetical protein AB1631_11515 [Acidobacteriota bacterium]
MSAESDHIDARIKQLRRKIDDLGYEIDAYKNRTAAAMGGGLFLLLLAAGALYDIATGNASIQFALGIGRDQFYMLAAALAASSIALIATGIVRERKRDRAREEKLDEFERELADMIERRNATTT